MFLSTSKLPSQTFALIFILAPIVFLITFINTDVALIILIFSMLLSPELKLAEVPQRAVVVRIDDILLIVVFFSWLAKMAINKQLGLLKHTPLNLPMIAYILVCILSTGIGILLGRINPLKSSFYILKYSEYFMLYFLVTNNIRDKQQIRLFITAFLITGVIICAYATSQIGSLPRVTAPFEGSQAEPNTLGGYLILLFAVCMGLFLYTPSSREKLFSGALAGFIILPFLFTLSRSSYFAFIPMYLTLIIFSKKKKAFLIIILILAVLIAPIILPMGTRLATERVAKTFTPGAIYEPFGRRIPLDDAASARVQSWKRVFGQWMRRPFLGYGVTGVGLVDAQYPRVLGETGIIGFWIFVWLLMAIFRSIVGTINNTDDEWSQGLALGLLAGFIGLLIQALGANTFIIVRIMEPFWFLTAVVMMLPEISKQEQIIKE
ncbi:MAG: O-antigen ligase family protein [Candidatus Omnitrophota bacterium]|jgi:hypothetical protein